MGASESTEAAAAPPPPDQQTQAQSQTTTQSAPSTSAPTPAETQAPTTTPQTAAPPSTSSTTAAPSASTSTASTPAPHSTATATATTATTATPTPTTPALKPSQLQLQAVAANVSSLALAPVAAGLTQPPTTTTTTTNEATPATTTATAIVPSEPQVEFEPYVLGDHTSGLWYSLVEWCAPFLPDGIVLAWDEEQVAELVQAISGSEYFRSLLTKRHQERRARLRALKDDPATTLPPLTNPDFAIPYDRAEQILDVDKRLGKLRKEFVPGRIAEDTFWYEYFLAVIQVIKAHVIGTQQHLRTQQIQVGQQQQQSSQSQQQPPPPQVAH